MNKVRLIIIGGFAGAGKSTLANRLAANYGYPIFSSDSINDAIRSFQDVSFHEASPLAYEVLWHIVRQQLKNDITVIVDTHMCSDRVWESVDAVRRDMPQVAIVPLILQCTLDVHKARIEERGRSNKSHLNLGGDTIEDVLFKYEYIERLNRPELIRIDANGSPDQVYASVDYILHP